MMESESRFGDGGASAVRRNPVAVVLGHAFVGIAGALLGLIAGLAIAGCLGWIEFRC